MYFRFPENNLGYYLNNLPTARTPTLSIITLTFDRRLRLQRL